MAEIPEDDEPLDPKVEAVRRKMVMLLALSGGIMLIGLMTVLIAIVYRLNGTGTPQVAAGESVEITVPAGATVAASQADEAGMTLTLTLADGATEIHRYTTTGQLTARYRITTR